MSTIDVVGKKEKETFDQLLLELEFKDYLGNALEVNRLDLTIVEIQQNPHLPQSNPYLRVGQLEDNAFFYTRYEIQGNNIKFYGRTDTSRVIEKLYNLLLTEVQTNQGSYTKFKFIR